ncbi:MAG: hypothetical protein EBR10_10565 [Planctomycetes bacterium]|nr:hypothetical protein [Planctomycetota bacterium]
MRWRMVRCGATTRAYQSVSSRANTLCANACVQHSQDAPDTKIRLGRVSGGKVTRSIGPALVGGQSMHLWVYLLGPLAGAIASVMPFWFVRPTSTSEAR